MSECLDIRWNRGCTKFSHAVASQGATGTKIHMALPESITPLLGSSIWRQNFYPLLATTVVFFATEFQLLVSPYRSNRFSIAALLLLLVCLTSPMIWAPYTPSSAQQLPSYCSLLVVYIGSPSTSLRLVKWKALHLAVVRGDQQYKSMTGDTYAATRAAHSFRAIFIIIATHFNWHGIDSLQCSYAFVHANLDEKILHYLWRYQKS
jgi:hypothetical protein